MNIAKGSFLIAMPGLKDPNFSQTVTCLSEHTEQGSFGLIINRVHPFVAASDIFKELKIDYSDRCAQIPVYFGGPVHPQEVFILHGPPFSWEGSFRISDTLALSNTIELLKAIGREQGPRRFLITLGCSGWGENQLNTEIRENVWLTSPLSETLIFDTPVENRWETAFKKMGIRLDSLTHFAGHA